MRVEVLEEAEQDLVEDSGSREARIPEHGKPVRSAEPRSQRLGVGPIASGFRGGHGSI